VPLTGLRILVVDDDSDSGSLYACVLGQAGALVEVADSPVAGLTVAQGFGPDVVLCDIAMPGIDGYTLLQRLRRTGIAVPALAVTAMAGEESRRRAFEAGFSGYLSKPIDVDQLIEAIEVCLRVSACVCGGPAPDAPYSRGSLKRAGRDR
jgi:CheY-like chemotaxis protein